MLDFVCDTENGKKHQYDAGNLIIAGHSLGTLSSWKIAFNGNPSIKGIHFVECVVE